MNSSYRHFLGGLHDAIRGGVPLADALATLAASGSWGRVARETERLVRGGETFAGALARSAAPMPPEHLAWIEAAETSGRLDLVLGRLVKDVEQRIAKNRALLQRLAYPILLYLMFIFLPPLYLLVSGETGAYLASVAVGVGVPIAIYALWRVRARIVPRGSGLRARLESIVFAIPWLGDGVRSIATGRVLTLLGLLLESGLGWSESLPLARRAARSDLIAGDLVKVGYQIGGGANAAAGLSRIRGLPDGVNARLASAERAGAIDAALRSVGEELEERGSARLAAGSWILPVLAIVGIGLMILLKLVNVLTSGYERLGL